MRVSRRAAAACPSRRDPERARRHWPRSYVAACGLPTAKYAYECPAQPGPSASGSGWQSVRDRIPRIRSSLMPRDVAESDSEVDRDNWLRGVAVNARCPCGASRFAPHRINGLEELPGPFPLARGSLVTIRLAITALRSTLGEPGVRRVARCGQWQLFISPHSDDAHPLVSRHDFVYLDADLRVGPHPLDLPARERKGAETPEPLIPCEVDGNDVGLIVMCASQPRQPHPSEHLEALF